MRTAHLPPTQRSEIARKAALVRAEKFKKDIIGKRYGSIVILERLDKINPENNRYPDIFKVQCDCGTLQEISMSAIKYRRDRYRNVSCDSCMVFKCVDCGQLFDRKGTKAQFCSETCAENDRAKKSKIYRSENSKRIKTQKANYRKNNREIINKKHLERYHKKLKGNPDYLAKKRIDQRNHYNKVCDDPQKYEKLLNKNKYYKKSMKLRINLAKFISKSQKLIKKLTEETKVDNHA